MSHWDFGRPPAGHDAPGQAEPGDAAHPGDAAYPDNARTPEDPWPTRDDGTSDDPWPTRDDWAPDDAWPADNGWTRDEGGLPADNGWTRDDGSPADDPWPAGTGWARDDARAADNGHAADAWPMDGWPLEGWPAHGGLTDLGLASADEGENTAPYPITYERDDAFAMADAELAGPGLDDGYEPWPPAPYPGEPGETGEPGSFADTAVPTDDSAGGRPGDAAGRDGAWPGRRGPGVAGHGWPGQVPGEPGDDWEYQGGGRRHGGARRWLIPAGLVVASAAVGAAAVLLTNGRPGTQASQGAGRAAAPAAPPTKAASKAASAAPATPAGGPLTVTQAQRVLAGYTSVNNQANAQRSDTLLATIEAGSSYAIDAGLYQVQQAAGSPAFPPFSPVQATYYIPRGEPAAGPRWFVVQVANAFTSNPAKVTSAEYLLFTQPAPGAPWQDAVEPYLLSGAGAPRVAVGADGMATAVSTDAATVAVAPGQLPAATAASLDGAGGQAVTTPGNLADRADQRTWQAAVPGGQVSDAHAPAAGADGQEFALLTADGGALVFYTDAAEVTVTPPAGGQLQLTVPGFYSPAQALTQARLSYLEQFAAYDPPIAAGGAPLVVADYSAITGAG
jgi:hypothetical protein